MSTDQRKNWKSSFPTNCPLIRTSQRSGRVSNSKLLGLDCPAHVNDLASFVDNALAMCKFLAGESYFTRKISLPSKKLLFFDKYFQKNFQNIFQYNTLENILEIPNYIYLRVELCSASDIFQNQYLYQCEMQW